MIFSEVPDSSVEEQWPSHQPSDHAIKAEVTDDKYRLVYEPVDENFGKD